VIEQRFQCVITDAHSHHRDSVST